MNGENSEELVSEFAGEKHNWHAYKSDIVGMGNNPEGDDIDEFWNLLRDGIIRRLGNQKFVYVKVYAAKNGDSITGECRINDIQSRELSNIVSEIAGKWDTTDFSSKKQFFFITQDEETYLEYPYSEEELEDATVKAVSLFERCRLQTQLNKKFKSHRNFRCDYRNTNHLHNVTGDESLTRRRWFAGPA